MILRRIYYSLSPKGRLFLRKFVYAPKDYYDYLINRNNGVPKQGEIFTGSGDFIKDGQTRIDLFHDLELLESNYSVLDVGSGIGRLAVPLSKYFDKELGSYEGFDVVEQGVIWCKENISSKHKNFNFQFVDLKNDLYNHGKNNAANFTFPHESETFDFVILNSVFTHMLKDEVEQYVKEINRVLKPGGKCFATFFLINKKNKSEPTPEDSFCFAYDFGDYSIMNQKVKRANVAYGEEYIRALLESIDFEVIVSYGYWDVEEKGSMRSFQDYVVLKKPIYKLRP